MNRIAAAMAAGVLTLAGVVALGDGSAYAVGNSSTAVSNTVHPNDVEGCSAEGIEPFYLTSTKHWLYGQTRYTLCTKGVIRCKTTTTLEEYSNIGLGNAWHAVASSTGANSAWSTSCSTGKVINTTAYVCPQSVASHLYRTHSTIQTDTSQGIGPEGTGYSASVSMYC